MYCPNCDTILSFSKNPRVIKPNVVEQDTPNTVSDDSEQKKKKDKKIIESGKNVDSKIKIDSSSLAYCVCRNCNYSRQLTEKTLISSNTTSSGKTYINYDFFPDMVHSKTLGFTREYICPNAKCISHSEHDKREAVLYKYGKYVQQFLICTACKAYWKAE